LVIVIIPATGQKRVPKALEFHKTLDEAVAEAYRWGHDWWAGKLNEVKILLRLFKLKQTRSKK
jgi:hypothetical protein